uniref:RCK N-terminal domain-containing protein n=1 Tax=Parascaris univalens TaxID=6257 RepID=A0A915CI93_PARUN
MVIVDLAANETLRQICNQKDVNADMAVVNPNRLIEEWIDDDVDVILYDRIMNSEVAAGSYLFAQTKLLAFSIDDAAMYRDVVSRVLDMLQTVIMLTE